MPFIVKSPNVKYTPEEICSKINYSSTEVSVNEDGDYEVTPMETPVEFKTKRTVPKLGVMLVGWGGNNGSTVTAGVLANKLGVTWPTKEGLQASNYYGSLTQCSTVRLGNNGGRDIHVPFKDLLPMVDPNDIVFDGWDISSLNIGDAMRRAKVLDYSLQEQLYPALSQVKPRPSVYFPHFIAANQADRADNVMKAETHLGLIEQIRCDIQDFKATAQVDTVIVLWTANTERFASVEAGLNDTAACLMQAIARNDREVSPSTLFATAAIMEGVAFVNGSPQNTFVPGVIELASERGVFIGGDDFKSGQTKMKSVLVDFLINAGIKPRSIVSYNHLGNNDGKNLAAPEQFRSKEISKSNVVDDMVASNSVLYGKDEHPDHTVVIKYVPYVGDSKRAMDEYTSEIFMGGKNTIVMHNTCEDSLLATPLILDLVILTELCQRITYKTPEMPDFEHFHSVLSILSYLLKAPAVPPGCEVVNSLPRQRACLENLFKACVGLPPEHHMLLEQKRAAPLSPSPTTLPTPTKK